MQKLVQHQLLFWIPREHPTGVRRLLPAPLKDAVEVSMWRKCYTMPEVNAALSKIQLVGYSQKIVSTWTAALRATPTTVPQLFFPSRSRAGFSYPKLSKKDRIIQTVPQSASQEGLLFGEIREYPFVSPLPWGGQF